MRGSFAKRPQRVQSRQQRHGDVDLRRAVRVLLTVLTVRQAKVLRRGVHAAVLPRNGGTMVRHRDSLRGSRVGRAQP